MSINLTLGLLDIESTHIALVSPPIERLTSPTVCQVSGFREKGFFKAARGSVVPHPIRLLAMRALEVTMTFANMTDDHLGRREPVRKVQTC